MSDALVDTVRRAAEPASSIEQLGAALVTSLQDFAQFDRLNIGLIDHADYTFRDAFVFGQNVSGRQPVNVRTLDGTVVEAAIQAGGIYVFSHQDLKAWLDQFPRFGPVYESGMRTMLAVMIGPQPLPGAALVLASSKVAAYSTDVLASLHKLAPVLDGKLTELRP
ncbi:MAG: hypothetical protein AAGD43_18570 [Pseudomonadota bacterium]